ncbi:hypothetical protein [Methylocaldum gracile]|uniref:hypothetical protein n=1 Tax=Methylocaldum sp. 0917 TaxID=2485163 RepID=UPI00105EF918
MSETTRKVYEPTDQESEDISRAGMMAAWEALQPLNTEQPEVAAGVLTCLRAFKAAHEAASNAEEALLADRPGHEYVSYFGETTDMVCSALYCILTGIEPSECSPCSVGGSQISIMFQAAKALEAMSIVYSAFDADDGVFGTYLAEETTSLAEAAMKRHNS